MSGSGATSTEGLLTKARATFHGALLARSLTISNKGVVSIADKDSKTSRDLALGVYARLVGEKGPAGPKMKGQTAGRVFEEVCESYVRETWKHLGHLRPGQWRVFRDSGGQAIAQFDQYSHLDDLERLAEASPEFATAIGRDYLIKPDLVIARDPEPDERLNTPIPIVDPSSARRTSLRRLNNEQPILHASISCKWTLRSDRAQNARSEGLNLVRNRKGRLPHIVVITAEPMPSRIASLALGTGDIDCVYHFALHELVEAAQALGLEDAAEMLDIMVSGNRLRDISDLPLDLA
ncbi:MAG: NgoMIV family type II restriction endonuclease, partial [Bacteroidota bacterium]